MKKEIPESYAFLEDGQFKVVTLAEETIGSFAKRVGLTKSEFTSVTAQDITADFFNAYEIKSGKISCNIEKAKKIKMDNLRIVRSEKFKKLDTEYIIALEVGDEVVKKEISQEKQKLRDMPNDPEFAKITTVEQLIMYEPAILTSAKP